MDSVFSVISSRLLSQRVIFKHSLVLILRKLGRKVKDLVDNYVLLSDGPKVTVGQERREKITVLLQKGEASIVSTFVGREILDKKHRLPVNMILKGNGLPDLTFYSEVYTARKEQRRVDDGLLTPPIGINLFISVRFSFSSTTFPNYFIISVQSIVV